MLLIKKAGLELHAVSRLVRAEEVATIRSIEETFAAAEAEAAKIRAEAAQAFEAEKARGYAKGLEDGKREIAAKVLAQQEESVRFMEAVEGKMTDVVMKALRKCVGEMDNRELVLHIVHKVMDAIVRNQQQITLKVAPEMVSTVKAQLDALLAAYPTLTYIDLQEDSRLKGAACIIETEAGVADASIDTQLAAIEDSIRRHFAKER